MDIKQDEVSRADSQRHSRRAWLSSVSVIVLLLLAFALRVLWLEAQSIWWDEGISLHLATSSWNEILRDRLANIHPPLYFLILKGWLAVAGIGAFTGRYLSVLASWLQVAVICGIAWRWFGRRTGLVALLLAAISAVSVIYAQEIRVYALLALVYLLLLAVTRELTSAGEQPVSLWLVWSFLVWFGIHLHYIALFAAAYVSVWSLFSFIRCRRWRALQRLLLALYLVFLASLPWFLAVWRNWTAVAVEAAAGTFTSEPAPLSNLFSQVWAFHITGLAGSLTKPGMTQLAAAAAALLLLLVLMRLAQRGTRRETAGLLAHWLVPSGSALLVWTVRSFSHPRYIVMFTPALVLLIAYGILPPKNNTTKRLMRLTDLVAAFLFLSIVLSSLYGLWLYFVDPAVAKDDVRGAARYLEAEADSNDLVLIPDTDWSLPFEYRGQASIGMPGLDDTDDRWTRLAIVTAGFDRVHLLDYEHGTRDWQDLLPFALGKAGTLDSVREFDGLSVYTYLLRERVSMPELRAEQLQFGPLRLVGSWIEQDGVAGEEMTVALRWELAEPMDDDARISLRLLDQQGYPVAEGNDKLLDTGGRPSHQWAVGEPVTSYHRVSIPPAVPPLAYDVELQVYTGNGDSFAALNILDEQGAPAGQAAILGKSHVTYIQGLSGRNQDALPLQPDGEPLQVMPGLNLLASEIESGAVSPGQSLNVLLLWQATAERLPDQPLEVVLEHDGIPLAENSDAPVYGLYPLSVWSSGEQVFERRILTVPRDASGSAEIVLRTDGEAFSLGEVEISAPEHSFTRPEVDHPLDVTFGQLAILTGFDLPQTTFSVGEPISLSLVWQSLGDAPEEDFVVFTHLLDEQGRLIAQHDGPPANGTRPTSGWVADEYIIDEHQLIFLDSDYTGSGQIEVGFYDPFSGERLLLTDGADHLILPLMLTVDEER